MLFDRVLPALCAAAALSIVLTVYADEPGPGVGESDFAALGINVVSVSVDDVAKIAAFADEQEIQYTMLADPDGAINERLGIRDEQYPVGSAQFGVPRPTLYVIDRSGTIRLRYMEPTYRTRPDLDAVLTDAAGLKF